MPFFLANPRSTANTGSVQRGTYVTTDYIRTEAGAFQYKFVTGYRNPMSTMVLGNLPSVDLAIERKGSKTAYDGDDRYRYSPFSIKDIPYVCLPKLQVQFEGRPREDFLELISHAGGEIRRLKGQTRDTWSLGLSSWDIAGDMIDIGGLNPQFTPTEGAISVPMVETTILLFTRVAAAARCLQAVAQHSGWRVLVEFEEDIILMPDSVEERMVVGDEPAVEATPVVPRGPQTKTVRVQYTTDKDAPFTLEVTPPPLTGPKPLFVTADGATTSLGGIFVAFEIAYAGYDMGALNNFLLDFGSLVFAGPEEEADNELYTHWRGGIARTDTGRYLAHMFMCCVIAKQMATWPQFIIRSDGKYEGAILVGEDIGIASAFGKWYEGMDQSALIKDMEECMSHLKAVKKILEAVGLHTTDPGSFHSLRALSQTVNAAGTPSGATINVINKWLPGVDFVERPEPINTDSLITAIKLLVSDCRVPTPLYMDKGAFFTTDRYIEVLSVFGTSAPSLNWGGRQTVRACDVLGKGVKKDLVYSTEPPKVLSTKQILLAACADQWRQLIHTGVIHGNFDKLDARDREYKGDQKKKLWVELDTNVRIGIIPAGGAPAAPITPAVAGLKRTLVDQTDVDKRADKRRRLFGK